MTIIMNRLQRKFIAIRRARFIQLLILTMLVFCLPAAGFTAPDSQVVNELKQKARRLTQI